MLALPQLARHYAKHASAVVAPEAVAQKGDGELTDLYLLRLLHFQSLQALSCQRSAPEALQPAWVLTPSRRLRHLRVVPLRFWPIRFPRARSPGPRRPRLPP